jgi:hypothetical protein
MPLSEIGHNGDLSELQWWGRIGAVLLVACMSGRTGKRGGDRFRYGAASLVLTRVGAEGCLCKYNISPSSLGIRQLSADVLPTAVP